MSSHEAQPDDDQPGSAAPDRKGGRRTAIFLGAGTLATGALLGYFLPHNNTTPPVNNLATGVAECNDNLAVTGVWVATDGKTNSGMAGFSAKNDNRSKVDFSLFIGAQTSYKVHVGCGGDPLHWATANYADTSAAVNYASGFICGPPPGTVVPPPTDTPTQIHGVCEQVGVTTGRSSK